MVGSDRAHGHPGHPRAQVGPRHRGGGGVPLADRTVPVYELSWFNGQGYLKVFAWWAIPDTSDSFANAPSLATFIRHEGLDDTVAWVKENLVKMAQEEVFEHESHRKWSPPLRRGPHSQGARRQGGLQRVVAVQA